MTSSVTEELGPAVLDRPIRGGTRGRVRKDVALCTIDGTMYSVMVGCGEQFLPAFVLALGMSEVASGLVATLPMLAGALLQLITPWAVRTIGSYRNWVVFTAAAQAASFLPLVYGILAGWVPGWLVFACATVYWAGGLGGGPAWTTWMTLLIPSRVRARYFARRAKYCHAGVMAGLAAGAILFATLGTGGPDGGSFADNVNDGKTLAGFAVIFGLAVVCRTISSFLLSRQSEPSPLPLDHRSVGPMELAKRMLHGRDGRLLAYATCAAVALQFCQPFLAPYFLAGVGLDGFKYGILLAAAFAGRIVLLDVFGGVAERYGPVRLLWIGAIGLVPAALLPLGGNSMPFLCFAQFVSGAAIAAHELALFLMYLEAIRPQERTSLLTLFNVLNSTASAAGSVLGGALLGVWRESDPSHAYVALFVVGTFLRLAVLPLLARVGRGPRHDAQAGGSRASPGGS